MIGSLVGAAVGIPAIAYLISPALRKSEEDTWMDLGGLGNYPLNTPTLFQFTRTVENGWEKTAMSYGVFVLRLDEKNVRVFSNICTHLGCRINWHPDLENYVSPCHDGHFDVLGNVVSGPPPRPLDEFKTNIEEGNLHILLPAFKRTS
jgi:Rieske Fe-S protein